MGKISLVIILLIGLITASVSLGLKGARADNGSSVSNEDQIVNDEGYGKDDVEYYNSEDDVSNDEGASLEKSQS